MVVPTVITFEPADVASRVAELGFPLAVLIPTIEVWIAAMNSGTPLHAHNYAGTVAWQEAVHTIRREGLALGLDKLFRDGVELCVCPGNRTAVVIAQGDARTGDLKNLHLKPSTKYPRGPVSEAVLTAQLPLFPETVRGEPDPYQVWILMLRMDGDETRVELSRPRLLQDGTILDWHERIFLGTFRPGSLADSGSGSPDLSPTGDVDVPLKSRA